MSIGLETTGTAPSAPEEYDPDKTKTNEAFSCVCKGTSSARKAGVSSDTEKPGTSRRIWLAPKKIP